MTEQSIPPKAGNLGNYLWRNGQRIELEKEGDRFTVIISDPKQVEQLRQMTGIQDIKSISRKQFRIKTNPELLEGTMAALRSEPELSGAIAHHAYHPKDSEGTVYYITDKIIVRFRDEATPEEIDAILSTYHLTKLKHYDWLSNTYLVQVTFASGENPIKITNRLMQEAKVVSAEPNLINRFLPANLPSDELSSKQWNLQSVKVPKAWETTRGDRNIVVAIIDDGFDLSHPDLKGDGKVVFPTDYADEDDQPFPKAGNFHGTPCAGIAIAEWNGVGIVGAAPGCAFMPVRFQFPNRGEDHRLIEIFKEVGDRSDVISCSWGPPPVDWPLSEALSATLDHVVTAGGRRGKGCVICFAAGNYNAPINASQVENFRWLHPEAGERRTSGRILNGFATHPQVISVAASTSFDQHAAYSNWGAEISVCAPSNNSHPTRPNRQLPGEPIWTIDNEPMGDGFSPNSRYTNRFGGTSSAAPLVAGIAALVLSANPELSAADVKEILQTTADKIIDINPDVTGMNRGVYNVNGRCDWFGFGKANAARAVAEALRQRNSH
ncbi:MAG: S8 family serine peptidase [Leptolyngbyaceae cyanobacterium HOT.MB2.61]|nr:S8 family serine peptidase [Leptolyngbyaceae cyanobacterium HOT.MB2.61]